MGKAYIDFKPFDSWYSPNWWLTQRSTKQLKVHAVAKELAVASGDGIVVSDSLNGSWWFQPTPLKKMSELG